MDVKVADWLQAAGHEVELRRWRDQSGPGTKHFVEEHRFPDVSPATVLWYLMNFDEESYRLWHPAHLGLQWENKAPGPGAIHIAWEKILGKLAAYRMRIDPPDMSPIPPKSPVAVMTNPIDTEGEVLFHILNEVAQEENELRITCTFVFPEAAPDEFVEAHRRHNIEEVPGLVNKAVPYLVKKTFGYMIEPEKLAEYGLIVPADAS
jgi:hypothetical protein